MISLYQFTISPFCEKARWALDHKGLLYKTENLLPGPHEKKVKKVCDTSQLPILRHGFNHIQGSGKIIDFLDEQYQTRLLTPEDPIAAKEAAELEKRFDYGFGVHFRRMYYTSMLKEPRQLRKLITAYGPWYGKNVYRLMLPIIKSRLAKEMKLNAMEVERSRSTVKSLLQVLDTTVENRDYLVGNQFSRADLTAAALLSPIILPNEHPYLKASVKLPHDLIEFRDSLIDRPCYEWLTKIYQKHRWEVKTPEHYKR